jgi:hypothetical protein
MRKKRHTEESMERMLAAAYRDQPVPEPSEQWHQKVMQAVRAEGGVISMVRSRPEAQIIWRAAWVAAAAAVIMTILGFWMMPSDARLAWQFQQEGAVSAWLLQVGE